MTVGDLVQFCLDHKIPLSTPLVGQDMETEESVDLELGRYEGKKRVRVVLKIIPFEV